MGSNYLDHLTTIEGVRSSSEVLPGMAFYAGTGPAGKTCGECAFAFQPGKGGKAWRCAKYIKLAMREGKAIKLTYAACKYFEEKKNRGAA